MTSCSSKVDVELRHFIDRSLQLHHSRVAAAKKALLRASEMNTFRWTPDQVAQNLICLHENIAELEAQLKCVASGVHRAIEVLDTDGLRREMFRLAPGSSRPLPALALREVIYESSLANQFLVVQGSTGSGKSTQLAQYFADCSDYAWGQIICTQPRAVAAITLAERVASEYAAGSKCAAVGEIVGFDADGIHCHGPETRIRYVEESMLMNEIITSASALGNYSVIILDEAHERTVNTDVLLGLLVKMVKENSAKFKLVVTSATLNVDLFSKFLETCPVITIPGRMFPVEVIYEAQSNGYSVMNNVVRKVMQIVQVTSASAGDILAFLPGRTDVLSARQSIQSVLQALRYKHLKIEVHCIYAEQSLDEQRLVCKLARLFLRS
jgi:HrpA-like RNA helicase